uniref:Uncharacterized protein n=1 Tax=viral metagenome TaxID=1070528 RepID=A0A6M3J5Z9_9ZZZZ
MAMTNEEQAVLDTAIAWAETGQYRDKAAEVEREMGPGAPVEARARLMGDAYAAAAHAAYAVGELARAVAVLVAGRAKGADSPP